MGTTFINLRYTRDDDFYSQFASDYNVKATPTVLILDSEGKEIDRIVGFDKENKEEFIQDIKDFAVGKNTLGVLLSQIEQNPDDVELNYKMAKKYEARYDKGKWIPYYEKILKLDPKDKKGYKTESLYEVAIHKAQNEKDVKPLKAFIASNSDEKYLINAYSTLAYSYQRKKEFDKSAITFEEALEKFPDNTRLMNGYASLIFNSKIEDKYEKALALTKKMVELDPKYEMSSVYNLISYYSNTGNNDKLAELFEESFQKWPDNTGLKSYFASLIVKNKLEPKYDYIIDLLQKEMAKEKNSKSTYLFLSLAKVYEAQGNTATAIETIKKAIEKDPENKRYLKYLEMLESGTEKKE